ncbi:MAG TPA: DUF222 domain-containing protein [Candidatus Acidoferrales bacterium]|nr:DUF222 domain-containing protein [Candidatus Acidoferrales bacterium]
MFGEAAGHFARGLELLSRQDLDGIAPVDLGQDVKRISGVIDRLQLERARRVELFDRGRGFGPSGHATATSWIRNECKMSGFAADQQVKLARQLPELESTSRALAAGEIGIEHALEIARATQDLGLTAEGELLSVAKEKDPAEVRLAARDLRHRVDADGMARLAAEQYRKRRLRIYNLADGMVGMDGALPPEDGAALRLTIESLAGIPPKGDDRTQEQRNADALSALLRRQLDAGSLPSLGGRKPQLTVVINAETLAGLPGAPAARLEGAGPISTETARRLLCRGGASLLTVNGKGVVLDLGRSKRTASEGQRRALSARYRHCCTRGCDREARFCEPHHLDPWELGGGTSVERMVLLCSKHHVQVHEGGRPMEEPRAG